MKNCFRVFCLIAITFATSVTAVRAQSLSNDYEKFYSELTQLAPDNTKSVALTNYVMERDAARFTLTGNITFCTPVSGRIAAAVFQGEAKFFYTPNTEFEKQQLKRNFSMSQIDDAATKIFFLFSDTTYQELMRGKKISGANADAGVISEALSYLISSKYKYVNDEITRSILGAGSPDYFYAYCPLKENGTIMYCINPFETEEILFMKKDRPTFAASDIARLINQGQSKTDIANNIQPWEESKNDFLIPNYKIDCSIDREMMMTARADMDISAEKDNLSLLYFYFANGLMVDSVVDIQGKKLDFYQNQDQSSIFRHEGFPVFFVRADRPLAQGEQKNISIYYHGKVLERIEDWVILKTSISWYPVHNGMEKSLYDLTYHTQSNMQFFSIGKKTFSEEKDGVLTTKWTVDYPVRNVSFNLGFFKDYAAEHKDSIPQIRVHVTKGGHSGITFGPGMEKELADEITNSLKFFSYVYGKCPVDEIRATEIPQAHGEAFPGLLHLYWGTFDETDASGFQEFFRAHEVSHQWWPMGVEYASDHDRWMSEGFAEFSGLWYMQTVLKNNEKYFKFLNSFKEHILKRPKLLPVWLGNRTGIESADGRDYQVNIYEKGAWVLHMLRNMMIDLNSFNEDKFVNMMRDFYTSYKGKRASTDDFRHVVEKHTNMRMDWFFNQWVYGAEIPKYTFSSTYEQTPEGKFKIHCKVKTENVSENFIMIVPVKVDFGGEKFTRVRTVVKGNLAEFDLPLMPLKPKEIVFNDLNSVLCEVDD